jgi:hypothetical protein
MKKPLIALSIILPAILAAFSATGSPRPRRAGNQTADMPAQAVKAEIRIRQEGKEPLFLAAKKPELSAQTRSGFFEDEHFWRFLFSADQPIISSAAFDFTASVDPNDLAGGGFYICSMKKADDKFYFNISGYNGGPRTEFIAQKPTDIANRKNQDGTFTYTVAKKLEPGRYALYFADNQYAWPFEVR